MKNVLVTGGCGFIASNFLNYMIPLHKDLMFINVDKMDYCASHDNLKIENEPNYRFFKANITNYEFMLHLFKEWNIDTVVHFAAQSHVDNSFGNSLQFTEDNIKGTHTLLECAKFYGKIKKFIHVSTDEVYGEVDDQHPGCIEKSILNPTNPYAATKAAAEMLVTSYHHSYKLPIIITRGNNVYGPNQHEEKLIPRFRMLLKKGEKMTLHGKGETKRNFIHVKDVARAFETIMYKGQIGEIYNIGTENEYTVREVAHMLLEHIKPGEKLEDWTIEVADRPFNDYRYAINTEKLRALGWTEQEPFNVNYE